jgi:hypothetical protein
MPLAVTSHAMRPQASAMIGDAVAASLLCLDQSNVHINGATAGQSSTPIFDKSINISVLPGQSLQNNIYQSVQVSKIDTSCSQDDSKNAHENAKPNNDRMRKPNNSFSRSLLWK